MNQPTQPCGECPFKRVPHDGLDRLGGGPPLTYIGQIEAGMWLPCHACYDKNVGAKEQDPSKVGQCAGAAIFRSNVNAPELPGFKPQLRLPKDTGKVFESYAEFLAYHTKVAVVIAKRYLSIVTPGKLAIKELNQARIQIIPK